ncbi:hypothetical protein VPH219E481_0033 [Vibrio phage 219E48-1]|nr:hypothetical protein PODOV021v1_p0020 [Vibrio phage 219E41.2]QZI91022.1 hypothetical protein PODOV032v1_p0017 [Vibrio phage 219E41.1]QZI91161.1 hypothetical protein PODOV060v1_p0067 [Vibrio phage 234P8]QZI91547.1 hypothetical protein PODOV087v1_p0042 [Vibrio phage 431E45.1]QZI91592.1 hypothetical protein PODOV086v1_p0008 [Vibrio phage 431E46.1]QZI91702.1 hypothetical protein PODOV088v1_p0041 [Vibrio phage 431E48.2]
MARQAKRPIMMPADILVNESIEQYNKRTGQNFCNIHPDVRAEVLRWLIAQHDLDFKQCPTELMTHSYVMKLADHLDEVAGKVNSNGEE